jgi:hypothetical protein
MVLPGFVLRALIPLGFMPMFGPGHGVTLTLCEGYAPIASMAADMPADMPMDTHGEHGRPPAHQDHGACPYGASPALAALAHSTHPAFAIQPLSPASLAAPQIEHAEIAPRAQTPRAPPQPV